MKPLLLLVLAASAAASAAPPAAVVSAIEYLRDQRSYSWEIINADPGPVAQELQTPRGPVTTVQRNAFPHFKGSIDLAGNILLQRDWPDGPKLDTLITATGAMVTKTPEGWLTMQEVLTAQADERLREGGPSGRYVWLRRADRPAVPRPDQELVQLLALKELKFEETERDTFVVTTTGRSENVSNEFSATFTLHLRTGLIRDYELEIKGSQRIGRARAALPTSEHRIVIITYVPIAKLDVPAEAWEKLGVAKQR
jgi:hypothetical protein